MNLCRSCGEDFGSVTAFDAHRVGKHTYTFAEGLKMEPPREDGRRCLAVDEMLHSGRFTRNEYGRWSLMTSLRRGRMRRGGVRQDATK